MLEIRLREGVEFWTFDTLLQTKAVLKLIGNGFVH